MKRLEYMSDNQNVLEMKNITKDFPGVRALDDVSFSLKKGEILGILGENGAGKSTLIKILSGDYSLEKGKIYIDGQEVSFKDPSESKDSGVRVIYQELSILEPLTVAENILIGERIEGKFGVISWKEMKRNTKDVLSKLNVDLNPLELMENLSVAEKQLIEIARAIQCEAKVLVMDEPTSALSEEDVSNLYTVIRKLKNHGVAIIYITHRMKEIYDIADKVMVLRDGKKVGEVAVENADKKSLVKMIVGKEFQSTASNQDIKKGEVIFEVKDLTYLNILKKISFEIREGEVVAFFGLLGAGVHKLFSILFGNREGKIEGKIIVRGKEASTLSPSIAMSNGLGYIPIDRKGEGLALSLDVKKNIIAANVDDIGSGFLFDKKKEKDRAQHWIKRIDIRTPNIDTIVNSLSGGNQQKVVIARWLEADSKIFLMDEPTRGLDIGAKEEIYSIIRELCRQGVAILLASSELPEVYSVSDRIIVIREGEIVGKFNTVDSTQEEIIKLASS